MVDLLKNLPQGLMTIPLVVDDLNCHLTGLWHRERDAFLEKSQQFKILWDKKYVNLEANETCDGF